VLWCSFASGSGFGTLKHIWTKMNMKVTTKFARWLVELKE
jgi:hypothetical protein